MPEVDPNALAKLQTLGEIVAHMQSLMGGSSAPAPAAVVASGEPASELGRFVLRALPEPAPGLTLRGFASAGLIAVTDDGAGVAAALVDALTRRGASAVVWQDGAALPDGARGLILLDGLASVDAAGAVEFHARAFERAKALGSATKPSLLVTVQDTGGAFGTSGLEPDRAWVSGLPGLARTANQEWAQASVKALDVQRGGRAPADVAAAIVEELLQGGNDLDVGLAADGTRVVLQSVPEHVDPEVLPLHDGAVIVASGGARGVTAATLIALAARGSYRFALLGRTPLAEESPLTRAATDDASIKRALLQEASARGESVAPAELGKRAKALLAAREVRATLDAIAAAGSVAEYVPVSVTDVPALTAALDGVRAKWGRIDALVHAAGVLADRKIEDKTREQFDRVFSTKVAGLSAMLTATSGDDLKLLVMFSSVAARYGNTGQVDYAMANEVLNKVAWSYAAAHPQCRVKSLGWGPWKGGMVTPQLEQHFAAMGVALIPLETGAQMMLDEIQHVASDTVELVLGGAPAAGAFAPAETADGVRVDVVVDRQSHPFLVDHSIAGTPVVPVAFAVEWFSRAARAACPGLKLAGLHDVSVLRGISLKDFDSKSTTLHVHTTREAVNGTTTLGLELRDDAGNRYYRARATMAAKLPDAPSAPSTDLGLQTWGDRTVYDGSVLFHGPGFQVIRSIDGVSDKGIAADVAGVREAGWQSPWCTDPLAVDGGLQLALLWSQHMLGGSSLPTAIGEVKTYATPSKGKLRCTLTGRRAEGLKAVADVVLHDETGTVIAELHGVETHQLPRGERPQP
ncbi:MAG: SDR family oxidoreductase [Nannocystaceae bacterium]